MVRMRLRLKTLRKPEQVLKQKREALMDKSVVPLSSFVEANPDGPPVRLSSNIQQALASISRLNLDSATSVAGGPVDPTTDTLRVDYISANVEGLRGQTNEVMLFDDFQFMEASTETAPVVTVVGCPEMPSDEFEHYERLIIAGSTILIPYELFVYRIDFGRNQLVSIDGASVEDLRDLNRKITEAVEERHFRVLVTHEVVVHEL